MASSIFVFLGVALVTLMRQGINIWQTAEKRGRIYERARSLMDTVSEDLRSMATNVKEDGTGFWIRCVCDIDENGRQRLRFVRSLAGEASDPIARYGGEFLTHDNSTYYDQRDDLTEAGQGRILPTGGYQEVLYTVAPESLAGDQAEVSDLLEEPLTSDAVWRGIKSPIGGTGTLFSNRNISATVPKDAKKIQLKPRLKTSTSRRGGKSSKPKVPTRFEREAHLAPLARVARPLMSDVLYLGFTFWTPTTNTWDTEHPPLKKSSKTKKSGPSYYWDSTRGLVTQKSKTRSTEFSFTAKSGSLTDISDDIFPQRIQVTVVIKGSVDHPSLALAEPVSLGATAIELISAEGLPTEGPNRFIMVGSEWIQYESISGDTVRLKKSGRGARGTKAQKHDVLASVDVGTTFTRVVEIPGFHTPRKVDLSTQSSRRR